MVEVFEDRGQTSEGARVIVGALDSGTELRCIESPFRGNGIGGSTTNTGRRWLAVSFGSFADLAGEVQFGPGRCAGDAPSLSLDLIEGFCSSAVISRFSVSAFSAISRALANCGADLGHPLLQALLTHRCYCSAAQSGFIDSPGGDGRIGLAPCGTDPCTAGLTLRERCAV